MEPRIQYAQTSDGVSIAYATLGSGPPLIYVCGWPGNLAIEWEHQFAREFIQSFATEFTQVLASANESFRPGPGVRRTSEALPVVLCRTALPWEGADMAAPTARWETLSGSTKAAFRWARTNAEQRGEDESLLAD